MSFQAYIDNIHAKTGKTPEDFKALAVEKGLIGAKAGAYTAWLKQDFGLGQGHAMAIWMTIRADGGPHRPPADERLDKLFSAGRAVWRETYESLLATAQAWDDSVGATPAGKYVSLNRGKKKFAIVQPGAAFLDLAFKRPGVDFTDRFISAAGWNDMLTHRTRIKSGEAVDAEILEWLRAAYEAAG